MRKQANLDYALRVANIAHDLSVLQQDLRDRGYTILADHVGLAVRELRTAEVSNILNNAGVPFNAARP